jgi:thiol-disulfide isomerase/thioredoxin
VAHITCPKCQSKLKLVENSAEQRLTCPRCRRLIRVSEDGTVAVLGEPGAAKKKSQQKDSLQSESQTIRLATTNPPRRRVERGFPGWAIYAVSAAVVGLLLVFIWWGTSQSTPTKTPPRSGGALFAEQSPQQETVSSTTEPSPARETPDSKPRKQRRPAEALGIDDGDTSERKPAGGQSVAKVENAADKSALGPSRPLPPQKDEPAKSLKEEPANEPVVAADSPSKPDTEQSSQTAGEQPPRVALAEVLPGKLDEEVGKILDEWQPAAAKFAAENAKTTDAAKVKSLLTHDPAKTFGSKLLELAEQQPNSHAAFQAWVAAIYLVRDSDAQLTGDIVSRAAKHLADHFGAEGMGKIALLASPLRHTAVRRLLQSILDKSPHREDRGLACLALIKNLKIERDQTSEPAALKRIDKQALGLVRRINNQEFGDVTVNDLPLADALKALAESLTPQLSPGSVAPEIIGKDLEGNRLKLSDYRGKVVMLEFWAGWCPHCRKLIPYEREFVTKMKKRPFVLLGVNVDKRAEAASIQRKNVTNWRSWQDGPNGPIGAKWQIKGYPTVFILDRKGTIRYAGSAGNWEFYDQFIKNLLAEADGKGDAKDDSTSASR